MLMPPLVRSFTASDMAYSSWVIRWLSAKLRPSFMVMGSALTVVEPEAWEPEPELAVLPEPALAPQEVSIMAVITMATSARSLPFMYVLLSSPQHFTL